VRSSTASKLQACPQILALAAQVEALAGNVELAANATSHAAWGGEIVALLAAETMERIVRHHHERLDGKGYPDGLAGERIPLGARIVAVAECIHNMLSDLRYKSARTFEDALAELRRCSGTQFDPAVVTAFLDWLEFHGHPREP